MNLETENEQLRTRMGEMAAEIERLQSVIDEENAQKPLAKSYKNSSTGTGIDFLVINEMPEGETELYARPIPAQQSPRITEQEALAIAESLEPFFDNITQSFDLPAWHGRVLWPLLDKLNGEKNGK